MFISFGLNIVVQDGCRLGVQFVHRALFSQLLQRFDSFEYIVAVQKPKYQMFVYFILFYFVCGDVKSISLLTADFVTPMLRYFT